MCDREGGVQGLMGRQESTAARRPTGIESIGLYGVRGTG